MAYSVSDAFKEAMKSPTKMIRAAVTLQDHSITSLDVLQNIKIESVGNLFTVNTKSITFKVLEALYDDYVGEEIGVSVDVLVNEDEDKWETLDLGTFKITETTVDVDNSTTTFKGYDPMGMLGLEYYVGGALTFPCTVAELISQISSKFQFALVDGFDKLPNANYTITEDLYENINGITYRDILAEAAGATATMLSFQGNTLNFIKPSVVNTEKLVTDNLKKYKNKGVSKPINTVVLSRSPQEDNIYYNEIPGTEEVVEVKLANNEILDDERQVVILPIYNAIKGNWGRKYEMTTEGHGWHEVGDRLYDGFVTSSTLTVDGSLKEVLKADGLTESETNYALAGGITKTIYNTEIKVDKQGNEIVSIVSKQEQLEGQLNENYTKIIQDLAAIILSVQNSGGNNLIRNSVGYVIGDDGNPTEWTTTIKSGGSLTISASSEAVNFGSASGHIMTLNGVTLSQRVPVVAATNNESTAYSLTVKVKKSVAIPGGSVLVTDGINTWSIDVSSGEDPYYREYSIQNIVPHNNYLNVTVTGESGSDFTITDLMLAKGDYTTQWEQANGEFNNLTVNIGVDGVKVVSSTTSDTYSKQTPFGIEGYENGSSAYGLNGDAVSSDSAVINNEIDLPPLKLLSRTNGWALVKKEN